MSAYLTDPDKIGKISIAAVKACEYGPTHGKIETSEAARIAEVLALENIRSIRARYHRAERAYKLDDPCEFFDGWSYGDYIETCRASAGITYTSIQDIELMSMIREYDYQSCETDDYYESLAYTVLTQLVWKLAKEAYTDAR